MAKKLSIIRHAGFKLLSQQWSIHMVKSAKGKQPESLQVMAKHVFMFALCCSQPLHFCFFLWTSKKIVFHPDAALRPSTSDFSRLKLQWKIKIILKLKKQINNSVNLVVMGNQADMKCCPFYNYCNNHKYLDRQAWANSVHPDQMLKNIWLLIHFYTVYYSSSNIKDVVK